jgi:ubiquinone/menaquinone biosynthesis C-methylase UbiE
MTQDLKIEVTAVDLSPRMVELTRERGVNATVVDAQDLPFAHGEFDCVVANWVVHHFPDPDAGVREMGRVLRPEGSRRGDLLNRTHARPI